MGGEEGRGGKERRSDGGEEGGGEEGKRGEVMG